VLKSILFTFLKPNGAHRNTQNPHIVNFKGVMSLSTSTIPAPTASPLNINFESEISKIAEILNGLKTDTIKLHPFNSLSEFTGLMGSIINTVKPYGG